MPQKPHTIRRAAISVMVLAVLASSTDADSEGRRLLKEIFDKPGDWSQMCMLPPPVAFEVPLPVFSSTITERYFGLGAKECLRLQSARAEAVSELTARLKQMDLRVPPAGVRKTGQEGAGYGGGNSGLRVDWLNSLHLQAIEGLNAIEALPELLRLEAQLHEILKRAESSVQAPLPPLPLDSPVGEYPRSADGTAGKGERATRGPATRRERSVFTTRVFQREMLGTISLLLRNEKAAGLQGLGFEEKRQAERARLRAEAEKELAEAKAELATWLKTIDDPSQWDQSAIKWATKRLARLADDTADVRATVPYTEAIRTRLRAVAERFLSAVPPDQWRGAAAMPKIPAE